MTQNVLTVSEIVSLVYKISCDLCNTDSVGYISQHLFQHMAKHKHSSIGKHLKKGQLQPTNLQDQFTVLKERCTKFDCLIREMLFIGNKKPKLDMQLDSIRTKLFT